MDSPKQTTPYADYRASVAGSGYDPKIQELLTWLLDTAEANNWSLTDIADKVRYNKVTIMRLLRGDYGATPDQVVASIADFRRQYNDRSWVESIPFVETAIARKVWAAIDYSRVYQEIVSIVGHSQWGKTTACTEYKRRKDEATPGKSKVILVRLPVMPSPSRMITLIAAQIGIGKRLTYDHMLERIKQYITPQHVLIVDESHQACMSRNRGLKTIETLREIYDECHCGLVLVGTKVWGDSLSGKSKTTTNWDGYLSQTVLRGINVMLPKALGYDDKRAIWQACGLPDPSGKDPVQAAALKVVNKIVDQYGLGRYVKRMRAAATAARKAGKDYTWDDFLAVHRQLEQLAGTVEGGDDHE